MCSAESSLGPILRELFPAAEMASCFAGCPFGDDIPCERGYVFNDAPPAAAHGIDRAPGEVNRSPSRGQEKI